MGLPLADDELKGIAQREEPALAAEGAHLAHVIHIHQRVPVDTLKAGLSQALFEDLERLSRQILAFGRFRSQTR